MIRKLSALLLILGTAFLYSCQTGPYELKEEDKLTEKETYHLFDYARHFIINSLEAQDKALLKAQRQQNQKNNRNTSRKAPVLTQELRQLLVEKDPEVRVHYTAPKTGKLSLSWLLPGKLQVIASAEGRLDLSSGKQADWKLRVITFSRDCSILPEELGIPAVD